jgi:hypothetical protein
LLLLTLTELRALQLVYEAIGYHSAAYSIDLTTSHSFSNPAQSFSSQTIKSVPSTPLRAGISHPRLLCEL